MPSLLTRPSRDRLEEACAALREGLGYFGYQWLCACAIFPHLRLALTIRLGNALARAAGRQTPDEDDLLALCRLPWFREGWIPDDLRLRLIADLAPEFQEPARNVIEHFLYGVAEPGDGAGERQRFRLPPSDWRSIVRTWSARRRSDDSANDALFVRWLHGHGPGSILYNLTRNLRRLFGARLSSFVDARALILLVVALAASALIWLDPGHLISDAGTWLDASYRTATPAPPPPPPPSTSAPAEAPTAAQAPPAAAPPPPAAEVFTIYFAADSSVVGPQALAVIQQAANVYEVGGVTVVQVTGYDDRAGAAAYSQQISERRARNVAAALQRLGVPSSAMLVSGRGQSDNAVPTPDGTREPRNRRVTIVLAATDTQPAVPPAAPSQTQAPAPAPSAPLAPAQTQAPPAAEAPPPPPPPARVYLLFFDWQKSTITPQGLAILQQAADYYKAGGVTQIQVTGYDDSSGTVAAGQKISEERAQNVAKALQGLGVPTSAMAVAGRGQNDQRVPTGPGVREPQNRRVEIVFP